MADRDQPSPRESGMGTGAPTDRRDSPFKGEPFDLSQTIRGGAPAGAGGMPDPSGHRGIGGSGGTDQAGAGALPGRETPTAGGQDIGLPVEPAPDERAQGVVEQRTVNILAGQNELAAGAGAAGGTGVGTSGAVGSGGAGASTSTDDPGQGGLPEASGPVGGTTGLGAGGPTDMPGSPAPSVSDSQRGEGTGRQTAAGRAVGDFEKARAEGQTPTDTNAGPVGGGNAGG